MARTDAQIKLRLPPELRASLKMAAKMHGRTLNAEILHLISEQCRREAAGLFLREARLHRSGLFEYIKPAAKPYDADQFLRDHDYVSRRMRADLREDDSAELGAFGMVIRGFGPVVVYASGKVDGAETLLIFNKIGGMKVRNEFLTKEVADLHAQIAELTKKNP